MKSKTLVTTFLAGFFLFTLTLDAQRQSESIKPKPKTFKTETKQQESEIRKSMGIVGPIRIQILDDLIIVTGSNLDEVRRMKLLIERMVETSIKTLPKNYSYKLKNAHAATVAPWVQHLFDKNFAGRQGQITVKAKTQSELLIIGAPGAVQEAIKIAKSLDK